MMIESKAHAALPKPRPTHWRQRWQIGAALAVDDAHFVTPCPCAKQRNSSTDAAAIAAAPFCVPFIEHLAALNPRTGNAVPDAAPLFTMVTDRDLSRPQYPRAAHLAKID